MFENGRVHVYAVHEITSYLRELFDSNPLLGDVWITGECSNVSRPASGHVYFTLKDADA
ncbi:MAG: exodeoxyribonuclease VII large subunit, partial [Dehalococcoidia bacterium]